MYVLGSHIFLRPIIDHDDLQEILEMLRSQMLSPIAPASLHGLRQLADKMEKILLVALDSYGNTFVEPKVELGARFGHLVCASLSLRFSRLPSICPSPFPVIMHHASR